MNKKKTILVTGGAGFVGSHLCERLAKDGHRVISLDNYFTGSHENHVPGVEYRRGHTKDIARHVPEHPDMVFHLGEYARVEQSVLEPDLVYDLNTVGTSSVVEFWKKRKCKLVYAGSSTKFGDGGAARHTSPYARTKAENSELVKRTGDELGLPYAITYFYNVYGPRERSGVYGTVIEHFKRMYRSGAPCAIVSPGTQERNFTHVADIVEGLIAVGERGQGDEYGLGNERAYSIFEVAKLFDFNDNIVLFPPRSGNRMTSALDTTKIRALGWSASRGLPEYVAQFKAEHPRGRAREKRVLVFSTTMHPTAGLAEEALVELARAVPDVAFDVVTTRFARGTDAVPPPAPNITLYRIGIGSPLDKFLLPLWGAIAGLSLARRHRYLFAWSVMASYAALAALVVKWLAHMPLLVTLADQNLEDLSFFHRSVLALLLSRADQVYGTHNAQEVVAARVGGVALSRNSLGEGDAFGNALRFAYADIVRTRFVARDTSKKKILIFSLAYHPHVGGAEVALKEITDRIAPSDIEFHMVTLRWDARLPKEERLGNVHVHRVGLGSSYLSKILFIPRAARAALELDREHHFDVLWAMMSYMLFPVVLARSFGLKRPYVLTIQEGDPFEHVFKRWYIVPLKPLLVAGFRGAAAVTAISTFLGGWARGMGFKGHLEIVPNGVDTAGFSHTFSESELNRLKDTLGKKMGDVFLVTTSRLVHKNGTDDVIRAMPKLPVNVHFLVLGIGPDERILRKLAENLHVEGRVHFLGQIGHNELPKYLKASDIFIRPSRSEGMGNSFVEAMAAGLPVIATQEGGLSDFIFDEKRNPGQPVTAWAVDKDSPHGIARAVTDVMSHPEKVRAVTATARAMVTEKYDWTLIARIMKDGIFNKVLEER